MTGLSGELFAGVGGLGLAVDHVFGTRPRWVAESDPAPSRVLEARHPGVPNLGDVTAIRWSVADHEVRVLSGGFPCQDVALSGSQAGLKAGTRSGLWSEFARAIEVLRPDWVVIENVRGLLHTDAYGSVESCEGCMGDRSGESALRALGAVLGDLAELGFDAEWVGLRASDVGAPHKRFRIFILAWPVERTDLVSFGASVRLRDPLLQDRPDLLPTPVASDSESIARAGVRTGVSHSGTTLTDAVRALLPTPEAKLASAGADYGRAGRAESGGLDLTTTLAYITGVDAQFGWAEFRPAIIRWEVLLGRPVPDPVLRNRHGVARLSPAFLEWMMGWPEGWVSDPALELSRAQRVRCCGNGVVPQQAEAALRLLLSREGVPRA